MDSQNRLLEIFGHFPGIGPRQAKRFVHYLMARPPAFIKEFTELVADVKKMTAECARCRCFFIQKSVKTEICPTCADTSRDAAALLVVARDSDFETIEKSGAYRGMYFILGGTVPVLDKEPENRIRLVKLLERVRDESALREIILSLDTTPDGEHTADIVKQAVMKLTESTSNKPLKISILGRGLSTGAELEYMDGETIRNALENRH
ncbi:MAG: recombination protein RecR [Candidatus Parcubacteria bacterium]|jgi:recombination protein RecR|nr:recombination protein RecR [Candidatus Parcubacteria bacterium]